MKKIFFVLLMAFTVTVAFANPGVNEVVLRNFNDAFPNVQNAQWYDYENYYEVSFEKDDMRCRIKYDVKGDIMDTRRDYYEAHLCPFIKGKITKRFPGKKISSVTEMTSDDEMYYIITLQDEANLVQVKATATGQMSIMEKLKKAKN